MENSFVYPEDSREEKKYTFSNISDSFILINKNTLILARPLLIEQLIRKIRKILNLPYYFSGLHILVYHWILLGIDLTKKRILPAQPLKCDMLHSGFYELLIG
jgi:hypothetical protein